MQHTFASIKEALDQAEEEVNLEHAVNQIAQGHSTSLEYMSMSSVPVSIAVRIEKRVTSFGERLVLARVDSLGREYAREYFACDDQKSLITATHKAVVSFNSPTPFREKLNELRGNQPAPVYEWRLWTEHRQEDKRTALQHNSVVESIEKAFPDAPVFTLGEQAA